MEFIIVDMRLVDLAVSTVMRNRVSGGCCQCFPREEALRVVRAAADSKRRLTGSSSSSLKSLCKGSLCYSRGVDLVA